MIVIKDLARQYNLEPYHIRETLRKHFKNHTRHKRWAWEKDDAELKEVRHLIAPNGAGAGVPVGTKDSRKA